MLGHTRSIYSSEHAPSLIEELRQSKYEPLLANASPNTLSKELDLLLQAAANQTNLKARRKSLTCDLFAESTTTLALAKTQAEADELKAIVKRLVTAPYRRSSMVTLEIRVNRRF